MKKENFVALNMGSIGGILFALGACMCMIPQWHALRQGVVVGAVGLAVLLAMLAVRRGMQGKPPVAFQAKTAGALLLGIVGALLLGVGMCMTMVWTGLLLPGILVGLVGILLLLSLIPICRGLQ